MFASTTWNKLTDADQTAIVEAALERPRDFGYHGGNDEMFQTWTLGPTILTRDSDILTKANAKALKQELESKPEFEEAWEITGCSHWAVGWVDHLSFQVKAEDGTPHPIVEFLNDWFAALGDYAVADDSLYSEMQYEEQLEQLSNDGAGEHAGEVFSWLWENKPEATETVDGDYLAATSEDILEAMIALGHEEPEEDDEDEDEDE